MGEVNPYQAPREYAPNRSNSPSDKLEKQVTALLLKARERGYTLSLFYRLTAARLILTLVYFAALMAVLASLGQWHLFALMLGLLLGMLGRDYGWARAEVKIWPVQERLMDWDKVQRMADGDPIA